MYVIAFLKYIQVFTYVLQAENDMKGRVTNSPLYMGEGELVKHGIPNNGIEEKQN